MARNRWLRRTVWVLLHVFRYAMILCVVSVIFHPSVGAFVLTGVVVAVFVGLASARAFLLTRPAD